MILFILCEVTEHIFVRAELVKFSRFNGKVERLQNYHVRIEKLSVHFEQ